jgi:hypothetical protein
MLHQLLFQQVPTMALDHPELEWASVAVLAVEVSVFVALVIHLV